MKDRIIALRKSLNLSQQAFADRLGIKRATISNYEIGRNDPVDSVVSLICREFGVREEWLRYGTGEMKEPGSRADEMQEKVARLFADQSAEFQQALVSTLLQFDPHGREWQVVEDIFAAVVAQVPRFSAESAPGPTPEERAALHDELDRQLDLEMGAGASSA